jgi:ATP-dependent protease ClpP protease subunit
METTGQPMKRIEEDTDRDYIMTGPRAKETADVTKKG